MAGRLVTLAKTVDDFIIDRALQLCRNQGVISLIVPNKLGSADYATGARRVVTANNRLDRKSVV